MRRQPHAHPHAHWHRHRRGRLHGRIFRWLVGTIVAYGLFFVVIFHTFGGGDSWAKEQARVERFVSDELTRQWKDVGSRTALVHTLATDLDLSIELRGLHGELLESAGGCSDPDYRVAVPGRGELLVCGVRHYGWPWRFVLALLLGTMAVWAASGRIARRLARPIVHLAEVARDLGDGRLESRARLDYRELGEIGVLTSAINDMAGKIQKQMREQRELLAAVSHELRTPLGHLRVLFELLGGSADPARLAELEREVADMDRLVGELLAGARVDFSALNVTRLDLAALAREALERLGQSPDKLRLEVSEAAADGDATLVMRATQNLIENATRHGRGLVALVIRARPGFLAIEAEDGGPGFAPAELERAFEPFQRRAGTGDDGRSLGLGLSLVRRIAESHRGSAHAENRKEGGARVGFTLPVTAPRPGP